MNRSCQALCLCNFYHPWVLTKKMDRTSHSSKSLLQSLPKCESMQSPLNTVAQPHLWQIYPTMNQC